MNFFFQKDSLFIFLFLWAVGSVYAQTGFSSFLEIVSTISSSTTREALVSDYMNTVISTGTPVIENDTVHFLYWDNDLSNGSYTFTGDVSNVKLIGDFTDWGYRNITMRNLAGTSLYYHSMVFEPSARLEYAYIINDLHWIPDPLNSQQISNSESINSVLTMPEYEEPWEVDYLSGIPHGTTNGLNVRSDLINREYSVTVYLPYGYCKNKPNGYPSIYFHDGGTYISDAKAVNIIDNLIANNFIHPLIAVFVQPASRNEEYAFMDKYNFGNFFANELVPVIDEKYNTSKAAIDRAVAGVSFGGNISALISYIYPDVFGNCGLQSASMWPGEFEIQRMIQEGDKKDIKYFSVWGSYEYELTESNRELKDVLIDRGYDLTWAEYPEAHHWEFFRSTIDEMLINFFSAANREAVSYEGKLPELFELSQNYPNPFNSLTKINFYLPEESNVKIYLYNTIGEKISTITDRIYSKGKHIITLDGNNLSSGVYYYSLITKLNTQTRGMILLK
ncbi:alpha/beta hydrolase-fold protein [Bacteroidota bacterium]